MTHPNVTTVVVADDEPDLLTIVRIRLERDGHRVITATNGPDALQAVREHRPSLAVLDVMMHGMSGIQVANALAADPTTADIPVLFLSARVVEGVSATDPSRPKNMAGYLVKPFNLSEFASRVQELAGSAGD